MCKIGTLRFPMFNEPTALKKSDCSGRVQSEALVVFFHRVCPFQLKKKTKNQEKKFAGRQNAIFEC